MRHSVVMNVKRRVHGPQNWGQIPGLGGLPIRAGAADETKSRRPNWDPTPNLLSADVFLALPDFCCHKATTSAVILGSDPDSADSGWHRPQRLTESGSDPNITAIRYRWYRSDSCWRFIHKGYSLISYKFTNRHGQRLARRAAGHGPQNWGQSPIRLTTAHDFESRRPNWDPTPILLRLSRIERVWNTL